MSNKDRRQSAPNTFKIAYGTNKGNNMIDRTKLETHILELLESKFELNPYYTVKYTPSTLEAAVNAVISDLPQLIEESLTRHMKPGVEVVSPETEQMLDKANHFLIGDICGYTVLLNKDLPEGDPQESLEYCREHKFTAVELVPDSVYNLEGDYIGTLLEARGVLQPLWDMFGGGIGGTGLKVIHDNIGIIHGHLSTKSRADLIAHMKSIGFSKNNLADSGES